MSDQVIRYSSEQEYLDYTNHRIALSTGTTLDFPDPKADPDGYWKEYYRQKALYHYAIFETWTYLEREEIEKGVLIRQHVRYITVRYDDLEHARASKKYISENEWRDPGVAVSGEFTDIEDAEKVRDALMGGEPGYYYDIKHRTGVAVIEAPESGKVP